MRTEIGCDKIICGAGGQGARVRGLVSSRGFRPKFASRATIG